LRESEIILKCRTIFENLGWEVRTEEVFEIGPCNPFRYDIVLRHNGEVYGFVEVISSEDLVDKAKTIKVLLDTVVTQMKPRVFVITNGYTYDVYLKEKLYGSLTVPPSPELVDIVLGGEDNE